MSSGSPEGDQVIQALTALQSASDRSAQLQANEWLTSFQHSKEAWATCHSLLFNQSLGLEIKMFAAQTFRAKVTYDLSELDSSSLLSLRSSLFDALRIFSVPGSRPILVQVCLSLADLAVQMMEWDQVVQGMIDQFGKDVGMVPALLEFLRVLPEEAGNPKIAMASEDMSRRCSEILSSSAPNVLQVLAMYIAADGVDAKIQTATFETLRSWLITGELMASQVAQTPLLDFTFKALDSPQLFDTAVDVLVDLIHETQEIDDNLPVIELLLPRITSLRARLEEESKNEDADTMRGLCRIFVEAGETYRTLILLHPETFFPLVQAIALCAAYDELEIVRITFNFWYRLAQSLGKRPSDPNLQPFLDVYTGLVEIIIRHLHFPNDPEEMNAEERDEFRAFRHTMGDTLKDCCYVLGSTACLRRSYDLIVSALSSSSSSNDTPSWQAIEAPLFSMRSMGAEVDPSDNDVVPLIMNLLPSLPSHPKVRYAAILVIGRYTEWIDCHPDQLQFMLQYVSSGFEDQDKEVAAASAQSMRYLCKDCKQHLVPYLPQLHTFLTTVGPSLDHEDVIQVTEAIAHVLSFMPVADAAAALRTFAMPLVQSIHTIVSKPTEASKEELTQLTTSLEQLATFLAVLRTFGPALPQDCASTTPTEIWSVLDALLSRYSSDWLVAEQACSLIRRGLTFFQAASRPAIPGVLERMAGCFEQFPASGFLWITGKCGAAFAGAGDEEVSRGLIGAFERETVVLANLLRESSSVQVPDMLDDYVHMLQEIVDLIAPAFIQSPAFAQSLTITFTALSLPQPNIIINTIDYLVTLLRLLSPSTSSFSQQQPCNDNQSSGYATPSSSTNGATTPSSSTAALDSISSQALRTAFAQQGHTLLSLLLSGLVGGYPEDALEAIVDVLGMLSGGFGEEMIAWLPGVVEGLPATTVPAGEKQAFLTKMASALTNHTPEPVKPAVIGLFRASRRSRERLRSGAAGGRLSLGEGGR